MSDFREELKRKKQAEENEKRIREAEEAKRQEQERIREMELFEKKKREEQQRLEEKRKRIDRFRSKDQFVSEVLNIFGQETWGRGAYKIERQEPEYWILSHYLGRGSRSGSYTTAYEVRTTTYEVDKYTGYKIRNAGDSLEINGKFNEMIPASREALEQFLLKEKPQSWEEKVPIEIRSSRCFIATAAYGSIHAPEVEILRHFRDNVLLTTKIGKIVTTIYYIFSPPFAFIIFKNNFLKAMTRSMLLPILCLITSQRWRKNWKIESSQQSRANNASSRCRQ